MKQFYDNLRYKYVLIVCYRWLVYINIKFFGSDKYILGYENFKLIYYFINIYLKKVKCIFKIEKKSYGKIFIYIREKFYFIFKNLNLKEKFDKFNCYNKKFFDQQWIDIMDFF